MMTFMHTLNSEPAAIFCLRFNDPTVLFHIGWSESKKVELYRAVQGAKTCTKVLTSVELKNNLIEIPFDYIEELLL